MYCMITHATMSNLNFDTYEIILHKDEVFSQPKLQPLPADFLALSLLADIRLPQQDST